MTAERWAEIYSNFFRSTQVLSLSAKESVATLLERSGFQVINEIEGTLFQIANSKMGHFHVLADRSVVILGYDFRRESFTQSEVASLLVATQMQFHEGHLIFQSLDCCRQKLKDLEIERRNVELRFEEAQILGLREMTSGLGHALNNPLMIATRYLQKLEDENLGHDNAEALQGLRQVLIRIQGIIDAMKQLQKMPDEESVQKISLNQPLKDALTLIEERFREKKIDLFVFAAPEPCRILGQSASLQRAYFEILKNFESILEAEPHPKVEISVEPRLQHYHIRFLNNGPAMTPEQQRKIFIPFVSHSSSGKGLGLGLSVAHRVIVDHGGSIRYMESGPLVGFEVQIPRGID